MRANDITQCLESKGYKYFDVGSNAWILLFDVGLATLRVHVVLDTHFIDISAPFMALPEGNPQILEQLYKGLLEMNAAPGLAKFGIHKEAGVVLEASVFSFCTCEQFITALEAVVAAAASAAAASLLALLLS